MRFLQSLSKWLIITFGSISLIAIMGVGAAGIHFKKEAIEYYTKLRDETQKDQNKNIFTDIKTLMNDLKTSTSGTKEEFDKLMSSAEQQMTSLTTTINELEAAVNNGSSTAKFASSQSTQENLKQLIQTLKSTKESLQTSINNVKNNIGGESGAISKIEDFFKPNGSADTITNYVNQAEGIFNQISNVFAQTPPVKFENYYFSVVVSLTAMPAVILGFGLIGSVTGAMFYTRVDGKLVRRSTAKKELATHIKKIVKKYPDILSHVK